MYIRSMHGFLLRITMRDCILLLPGTYGLLSQAYSLLFRATKDGGGRPQKPPLHFLGPGS